MRAALQLCEKSEIREIDVVDTPHLENVVWTNHDAILLSLAARAIDDWQRTPRLAATFLSGTLRMRCGAPRFLRVLGALERFVIHVFSRTMLCASVDVNPGFARPACVPMVRPTGVSLADATVDGLAPAWLL